MSEAWPGLLAAAALAWLGLAARARRQKGRRRAFNPYVTGGPVLDPQLFVGRTHLLAVAEAALRRSHVLLWGDRRIGKTSLLHHLRARLAAAACRGGPTPVLVDLQGVSADRILAALGEEVAEAAGLVSTAAVVGTGHYGGAELACDLRRATAAGPVALLVDEADALCACPAEVGTELRQVVESLAGKVAVVMAGTEIRSCCGREDSPWRQFFLELEVGPLATSDATVLVQRPLRGLLEIEERAVEHLVAAAKGRPHALQRLCAALVDRAHQLGRRTITLDDAREVTARGTDSQALYLRP